LRRAFAFYVDGAYKAKTGASHQEGQGIELAGVASGQRRHGSKWFPGREIEVQAERKRRARESARDGIVERWQIDHHRSRRNHARLCRFDYSSVDAA
jgi:hypothetical protein